jgi:hypothetical protein
MNFKPGVIRRQVHCIAEHGFELYHWDMVASKDCDVLIIGVSVSAFDSDSLGVKVWVAWNVAFGVDWVLFGFLDTGNQRKEDLRTTSKFGLKNTPRR